MCALASEAPCLSSRTLLPCGRLVRVVSIGGKQCPNNVCTVSYHGVLGLLEAYPVESKDQKCVRWLQTHHVRLAELCVGISHGHDVDV